MGPERHRLGARHGRRRGRGHSLACYAHLVLSARAARETFGRSVASVTSALFDPREAGQFLVLAEAMKEIAQAWPEQIAALARTLETWHARPSRGELVDIDDDEWLAFSADCDVALDATRQVSELFRSRTFERVVDLVEERDPAAAQQLRDLREQALRAADDVRQGLERMPMQLGVEADASIVPARVVLSEAGAATLAGILDRPPDPTPAMRRLMGRSGRGG